MIPAFRARAAELLPGLALTLAVSAAAVAAHHAERALFGRAWIESLVLAILIGTAVRTFARPDRRFARGVGFSARTLLEVAVMLLGASISTAALLAAGPVLLAGIALVVAIVLPASYAIGRALGLNRKLAVLVACGNSICGNSAIVATAPVIGASETDIASSIAFTAVLGVATVLLLPLLVPLLDLTPEQYGVLAGLTVYAVPQVLAATAPVSALSVEIGTLVKLVRVLMLVPVILVLTPLARRAAQDEAGTRPLVPWFIVGFALLVLARSLDLIPGFAITPIAVTANALTLMAMAALGLGVDLRSIAHASGRVTAAGMLSLLVLGGVSYGLIRVAGIG